MAYELRVKVTDLVLTAMWAIVFAVVYYACRYRWGVDPATANICALGAVIAWTFASFLFIWGNNEDRGMLMVACALPFLTVLVWYSPDVLAFKLALTLVLMGPLVMVCGHMIRVKEPRDVRVLTIVALTWWTFADVGTTQYSGMAEAHFYAYIAVCLMVVQFVLQLFDVLLEAGRQQVLKARS